MRKKVLIITDSISLPRPGIKYEETWIYLLKQEFPELDIMVNSEKGSMTSRLVNEGGGGIDLLELYEPHLVIVQMGITECAPRLFKKHGFEHFFLTKILLARLRSSYIDFVRKRRIRNPEIPYIRPEQFKANLTNYIERAHKAGTRIIILSIFKPNNLFASKSPSIGRNIQLYNDIYRELAGRYPHVRYLDPIGTDVDMNAITIDELHINQEGNKMVFAAVRPLVEELVG